MILSLPLSLLIDRVLGEPSRYHPLVGFGLVANYIEAKLNQTNRLFFKGVVAWLLAVIPITYIVYFLDKQIQGLWLSILFAYLSIGWQSLRLHALDVYQALSKNDLQEARLKTSYLVSRNTKELDESALSRATIESLLENGSDAIFAPLFWLLIFGAPGVLFYRLCNTLDAMWGYRNQRFEQFGKFTAHVDDVLNYIPARISALLYTICGNSRLAIKAWKNQGNKWYSPNAGVVMATGAGALKLKLGGAAVYNGVKKARPELGYGATTKAEDIQRAIKLLDRSVYLLIGFITVLFLLIQTLPLLEGVVKDGYK